MIQLENLVRKNVLELTAYSSARAEFNGENKVFLDANENPFGDLNRYPDPYQSQLKEALSMRKSVGQEQIFLGNGSDEVIDLAFRIFCNPGKDKALSFYPTYGMYEVSAAINQVELIQKPLTEDFQIDLASVAEDFSDPLLKLIFICSPNNPTGNLMDEQSILYLLENFNGLVLLDEAYIDFADRPSLLSRLAEYDNLILMQTFSKAWGLAGARLGVAYASAEIITYFNRIKPPYNVSSLNQQAVLEALNREEEYKEQVAEIKNEKSRLQAALENMEVVQLVYPSQSNFLLLEFKDADAVYNYLLKAGIVARNRNSVVKNCLRITVGTSTENNQLINALKSYK
jgi:histidinol-phosphate aminotransferase